MPIRAREASEFFIKKYKISCKHSQEISRFRLVKSLYFGVSEFTDTVLFSTDVQVKSDKKMCLL